MVKAVSTPDLIAIGFTGALFVIPILSLFYTGILALWENTFDGSYLGSTNIIIGVIVISVLFFIFFISNIRGFKNPTRWKI